MKVFQTLKPTLIMRRRTFRFEPLTISLLLAILGSQALSAADSPSSPESAPAADTPLAEWQKQFGATHDQRMQ